jgi:[ribosomal protein S5]-alanine N-acetyltransferase
MKILDTERLSLRHVTGSDAAFILKLLNEPSFISNIGDRGVRTEEAAAQYIEKRFTASYQANGFGLFLVELRQTGEPAGICGLVKRDGLDDPDIGFAFVPAFWSKGFAYESASAVMGYARDVIGLPRIVAITAPHNEGSMGLLRKLGLRFEKNIRLPGFTDDSTFFVKDWEQPGTVMEKA